MTQYAKPLPVITPENRPFWEAVRQRELRFQRCEDCGSIRWPIYKVCPQCLSERFSWSKVSGKGTVVSWVVFHRPY